MFSSDSSVREEWVTVLSRITSPVLDAAASGHLRDAMPVYNSIYEHRCLEAVGRVICGIAPWLQLRDDDSSESRLRKEVRVTAVNALTNIVNPGSSSYCDFGAGQQSLVDAAYLAQGLLRAPCLLSALTDVTKSQLVSELVKTRRVRPCDNNWLLFSSTVEALLLTLGVKIVRKRLWTGLSDFVYKYYIGDGLYGDGLRYNVDYYNSFVIHPMLVDVLSCLREYGFSRAVRMLEMHLPRYKRFVELQERMISPEGAYPIVGRTLVCRLGAFHALSQSALLDLLPDTLAPAQVRCALHSVLQRHFLEAQNIDDNGFLTVGFNGSQESTAEEYVSSGSAYHCVVFFVCLGLPPESPFWSGQSKEWTSRLAFSGKEFLRDRAYVEKESAGHMISRLAWLLFKRFRRSLSFY